MIILLNAFYGHKNYIFRLLLYKANFLIDIYLIIFNTKCYTIISNQKEEKKHAINKPLFTISQFS